jgi:hypothetical protein
MPFIHLTEHPPLPGKKGKKTLTTFISSDASSLFEIRSSPGKGLGVFATKNIPRDAVIMRDPVVFQYQKGENLMEQYHRFTMLPKTTRRNILNLTAPYVNPCGSLLTLSKYRSRMPKKSLFKMVHLQNITASNVLPTYYDAKLCGGLFLNACRINHSCIPNADHASKDDYGYMVMRANRDIDAGEEITYSYTMHCAFRVVRQHLLSERWDFTCQCPACDPWHPFCHSHEQRFHTLNKLCQDVDADKEGRLKSAETWPYAALEQESDRSRRRIELLAEHHSLREFSHDECVTHKLNSRLTIY